MARVCQLSGKKPQSGHHVSHSNHKTKRRFLPNVHVRRLWLDSEHRFIKLRISAHGIRQIDKLGLEQVLSTLGLKNSAKQKRVSCVRTSN